MLQTTRGGRPDAGISIGEIRSKKVAIDWPEAIAILQALCKTLCGPGGPAEAIRVDTQNVFIHADGTISVVPSTDLDSGPLLDQLLQVLTEILAEESVRQPLRAALFHPAQGTSVEDWSRSIEYYERRNRSVQIQAVYERAVNAAVRMTAEAASPTDPTPVPSEPKKFLAVPPMMTKRLFAVTGLAVAAVTIVVFTVAWMVDARILGLQSSYERSALAGAGRKIRQGRPPAVAMAPAPQTAELSTAENPAEPLATEPASSSLAVDDVRGVQPASIVYSREDEDVLPPSPIDPRLPDAIPTGIRADQFAEFEVLVTEAGGVESVKARRVPGTMADAVSMTMSLSAVKTWRFYPAMKDGAPVRYRKIVWVLKS